MMDEKREAEMRVENVGTVNCPSCDATLVAGLRFCRMCGYRLGEGVEEYVQTQLLNGGAPRVAAPSSATDPFAARATWGHAPLQTPGTTSLTPRDSSSVRNWASACNPRRGGWMVWIIMMIVLLTASGVITKSVRNRGGSGGGKDGQGYNLPANSISKEVDDFNTADGGGAFIEGLSAPDTSLERAGIIGGDIITSFDGKNVPDEDTMRKILAVTPPGKAVEIIYIHDGETKRTILTTAAEKDFRGLDPVDNRPGGKGVLGLISRSDLRRVRVPNSNIYGVELGRLELNGPADLAGLKRGDIVTDFDGKPIRTPGDLRLRIYEAVPNSVVNVVLLRDGQRLEIPMKMGRGKAD
jgi:membrane-associated protease RseP (regulator of RpoE activity)